MGMKTEAANLQGTAGWWVAHLLAHVGGGGCLAISGRPQLGWGSGPVTVSGGQGLCVSYSSPDAYHRTPSCVALDKLLNLSVLPSHLL